ncbi:hypothetical protein AB1L12_06835 [Peribacillus frigoritolerans]|uniref:hypothetical protein n=1 Tax=Peribacillus frigoritolerans TaxID=450367 RepID=UPI00399FEAA8
MNINIKVYLHAKGTNFLQSGNFPVTTSDYKKIQIGQLLLQHTNGFSRLKVIMQRVRIFVLIKCFITKKMILLN